MPSSSLRDGGLRRVARGTRLLAAGSIVGAGIFSFVVARAHPGSSTAPIARRATRSSQSSGLSPAPAPGSTTRVPVAKSAAS